MNKKIYIFFLLLWGFNVKAQTNFFCGFDSTRNYNLKSNPDAQKDLVNYMLRAKQAAKNVAGSSNSSKRSSSPLVQYIIPVVVHIIHNTAHTTIGTGTNISDSQVFNQLVKLNECFLPYRIRFCLAAYICNMNQSQDLLAQFKSLSISAQSALLQSLRAEFEGKGKLLEVAESEITIKKACPSKQKG